MPSLIGRSKVREFQGILERVSKRIGKWKTKFPLEIMLKAVIQAIPTYCMSVFLLPKLLCNELNSLMSNFWWDSQDKVAQVHWKNWESLSLSKREGRLGFRDLRFST